MQPESKALLDYFSTHSAGSNKRRPDWLNWFPFDEQVVIGLDTIKEAVTVVDVRGGLGQELLRMKERHPDLPGRLILQNLQATINGSSETTIFEFTVHDLLTPQSARSMDGILILSVSIGC